jgi:adenosylcobinamide kinase / adenosylcobinamide-phosphate guanylyltransferase
MGTRKKSVTLVLGGARSGKSRYAQELASRFGRVVFVATARRSDPEMRRKINSHRQERPSHWRTLEAPLNLSEAVRTESTGADVVLIDCFTLYLANVMRLSKGIDTPSRNHIRQLCEAIQASASSVIAVSNEVGSGIVPPYRSGRVYRDLLGQLNQEVAEIADNVVLMVSGLPIQLKGSPRLLRRTR